MREHEIQIQKYTKMLPRMRERVVAALALLLVAAVMTVSASFAWVVLTTSPEVKGLTTTISANGNLEIALANGTTITPPQASQVGDGGKDLAQKNITWGNLINLSDASYGLEHIVLRPAKLNDNDLIGQPLYGAGFGADGRVEQLVNDFSYAYWNPTTQVFSADSVRYGVRTISSVVYGNAGGNIALAEAERLAKQANIEASDGLDQLAADPSLQELLSIIVGYVEAQINEKLNNGVEPTVSISDDQVRSIGSLMEKLKGNMEVSADALAANYNVAMLRHAGQVYMAENKFTGEFLINATRAEVEAKLAQKNGNEIIVTPAVADALWQLRTDYVTLSNNIEVIKTYYGRGDVVFRETEEKNRPQLEPIINTVADITTSTINGTGLTSLGMGDLAGMAFGTNKAVITQGILQRMHKFTGANATSPAMSAKIKGISVTATVTTNATAPFILQSEYDQAMGSDTSYKGTDPIAKDTYGMALDLFLRTNASGGNLVLQGTPVYSERDVVATAKIGTKTYNVYTVVVDGDEKIAYLNTTDNTFYEYNMAEEITLGSMGTADQYTDTTLLTVKEKYIVGYHGVNRVWSEDESAFIDGDSTTQGAGSCYTFYSSSPEDQDKAIELLSHFRVAFVSQDGQKLGEAYLDTKNPLEQTGKVIVPLVLSSDYNTYTAADGSEVSYITALQANTPTFITAIVYLEGSTLTNDQVLAAGEIQGQLNLQFGTTANLNAVDDSQVMQEKCYVSATMVGGNDNISFDTATAEQLRKQIALSVTGYTPKKVEAHFLREVNSTQGVRQDKMTFQKNDEGAWIGTHTFDAPGKYILRDVLLDGVTYELEQPITLVVEGFGISQISCVHDGHTYMTAERSFDTSVRLTFASNDPTKMPSSVKGAFIHTETGNRTTVYFTHTEGGNWVGEATLVTSGEYKLDYLELDGEYTGLPEDSHIQMRLYLGLTAKVYTASNNLALESGQHRKVEVTMTVHTDNGDPIAGLEDVWLQYGISGSTTQENGIGSAMAWSNSRKCYVGEFQVTRGGVYNYYYTSVEVDGELNYINRATIAPEITVISSSPVHYLSKSGFGEAFSLSNDAAFKVRMRNAGSATVDARVTDANGKVYYIRGNRMDYGTEQEFTFVLPVINNQQSGTYTLQGLYLTNIYGGANNSLYNGSTEDGPDVATDSKPMYNVGTNYYLRWLHWPLSDITNDDESDVNKAATITVVSEIAVSVTGDSQTYTGTFGKAHKLDGFNLSVQVAGGHSTNLADYGITLNGIEANYAYDTNSVTSANGTVTNTYGNYTLSANEWNTLLNQNTGNTTVRFTNTSQNSDVYGMTTSNGTAWLAGEYKLQSVSLTLTANGNQIIYMVPASMLSSAPVYTITSTKPSVTATQIYYGQASTSDKEITITSSGSVLADTSAGSTGDTANGHKDDTASISTANNKVTVVAPIRCRTGRYLVNWRYTTVHGYSAPRVTLTLSDIGIGTSAKLAFNNNTHIYSAYSYVESGLYRDYSSSGGGQDFTWSGTTTTCSRYIGAATATIGRATEAVSAVGTKTPAGTITATTLEVTYSNCTFKFVLDNAIVIQQSY